jgi:RNA polymerase sigma factor (sigma-70 family)
MGGRLLRRVSDAKLVHSARAGDARAFEELYRRHHSALLSFCRHLTGRLEDAEDAVQHTFLNAHRTITGGAAELDLKPWLFTVARNRCLSLLRARRVREPSAALWTGRRAPMVLEDASAEPWGVEGLAEEVERREELRELVADLGGLPEPQRAALVLSELEALNHAQIAQVLDVEPAKVRALVFQARSSLLSSREARDTSCGEIRMQLSTLRGSSLRRRTLRRHVRACPGCSDFEAAVLHQRRDFAIVLPVIAAATMRDGALPTALAGGAASGAAAVGGGAAAVGGGAAAGAGGLFSGVVAAVAGGGAVQLATVVAVAAAGTVGVVKTGVPERIGLADGAPVERAHADVGRQVTGGGPATSPGTTAAPVGTAPGTVGDRRGAGEHGSNAGRPAGGDPHATDSGHGNRGKNAGESPAHEPPGVAKKEGGLPPGLAKKGDDPPRGWANGNGHGNGNGKSHSNNAGNPGNVGNGGAPQQRSAPPGQSKKAQPQGSAPESPGANGSPPDNGPRQAPPGQVKKQEAAPEAPAAPEPPATPDKPGKGPKEK